MYSLISIVGKAVKLNSVFGFIKYQNVCRCLPSAMLWTSSNHYVCKRHTCIKDTCYYKSDKVQINLLRPITPDLLNVKYKSNTAINVKKLVESFKSRNIGGLATIFVDKSSESIQPYLKLMRIDRPIGMYSINYSVISQV